MIDDLAERILPRLEIRSVYLLGQLERGMWKSLGKSDPLLSMHNAPLHMKLAMIEQRPELSTLKTEVNQTSRLTFGSPLLLTGPAEAQSMGKLVFMVKAGDLDERGYRLVEGVPDKLAVSDVGGYRASRVQKKRSKMNRAPRPR